MKYLIMLCFLLLFSPEKQNKTEKYKNKLIQHKQYNLAKL
jgi:hypothetical protein